MLNLEVLFLHHYFIYRDQDGDSNDIDENTRLGSRSSIMSGTERLHGGKSMSIMNTQLSSRDKGEPHQNHRNVASTNDKSREPSSYQCPSIATAPPASLPANVGGNTGGSNNNLNNSTQNAGITTLDSSTNSSQTSNTTTGNSLNNQAREQK